MANILRRRRNVANFLPLICFACATPFQLSLFNRSDKNLRESRRLKMAKIMLVLALMVAMAYGQPIETITTSGDISLSTHLWNWGQAAFEAILELAKQSLETSSK